jgi:hypothetical protein
MREKPWKLPARRLRHFPVPLLTGEPSAGGSDNAPATRKLRPRCGHLIDRIDYRAWPGERNLMPCMSQDGQV